ncbi:glycosyltransferase family 2 protein [Alicyclobacillus fastidiosus]|uniref:Glycosyltransferase family 2 protein n=1 Tax=Alicyclobacillus fastidiosus TaxID=392011 RepID=A0ABY6ZAW7_9BACL|nr:glycosyltransferase [Alicyclobacillus fastidiosus]WAH39977.1 glycosyltransferase family 2 protein [Alicyclobacillus fastidiosus]GMA61263.1 N-acetylglucosaminyltransferase [Alicyclobacillus fastidiosus]
MNIFLLTIAVSFWLLLSYYSVLNIAGIIARSRIKPTASFQANRYPSVAILIPAHNEGKVLASTLHSMVMLEYPGDLSIYVLNDNSTDNTGEIADEYANAFPIVKHIHVPPGFPKGKARVLNHGLSIVHSEYIAVYDADNQPEPRALIPLVEAAMTTPDAVGAVGYVKTLNETRNWLTRMIAIEFSVFQLLMQCGRSLLMNLGSFTGTNMVVSRQVLLQVNGWEEYALAEDADLTMKLTAAGGTIPVVWQSRTWEQEPERFRIWFRQRTRWMQGNLYLIQKTFREPTWLKVRSLFHTVQLLSVYIGFVLFLLISDVWFVLGVLGVVHVSYTIPLLLIWFESLVIYIIQLMTASNLDGLMNGKNMLMVALMYFTYAQLWVSLLLWAIFKQIRTRKLTPVWDKTVRF